MGSDFTEIEVGSRYESTRLLICGEASGAAEAQEGLPFRAYAQAGSLLADCLREANISRSEVAITNVLRCRPKNDWLEGAPYSFQAISNCVKNNLYPAIEQLRPRAILAVGGTAFRALVSAPRGKYGSLDYCRGFVHAGAGAGDGIPVIPTYHTSFVRRGNAHLTPLVVRDIRRAFLLATGKFIEGRHFSTRLTDLGLRYQTSPTIDEAWAFAESIDPALPLAFDIETPLSTRSDEDERTSFTDRDIKLFQCTQSRGMGIAIPFRDEFIDVVRRIVATAHTRIGFNNWNFDDPVLAANGIDVGVTEDAMVMFGTFWSDLPKNLQAAAQMCGFPFPWKALGETDLAFYGCADVDATLCVYESMVKVLGGECVK
jgi:uracil-DNA glycosylase